jgi:putative CRISPR-associated protein (TIGR02619 family)
MMIHGNRSTDGLTFPKEGASKMPYTYVCSVGISAAKGIGSQTDLAEWVAKQPSLDSAARVLFEQVKQIRPTGEHLQKELSAEIHSLTRMGVSERDRVILLCSETDDGVVCGNAVRLYLEEQHPGIICEVRKVEGLQVSDVVRFRTKGVVNFVRECLKAVQDYGREYVVLNPTGGFKALVPYTVLVGMLKRVSCQYIFEQSTSLLTLPPLPVTIDRGPLERYRSLFEDICQKSSIPKVRWEAEVSYHDRSILEPLVEIIGEEVTTSGIGDLFLDEFRTPSVLVPFLSRKAWEDCYELSKLESRDPYQYLERMAANWNPGDPTTHCNNGNGTYWLKPGNTPDRYLVSVEGWKLLVWRVASKTELGGNYIKRIIVNPIEDRSRLGPFTRMEFADPIE